ncbi:flagellar basal-body MS-ring/collar protein FliF [Microterricola pindariensis]|uniref:Flagellar M-ring protein n=1 Tax=Microterricola pindariensis TaxID=478010 RepID=A0ABX5AS29_9MICO|nr:flagellar basal-body MS-ring/collar protein FliF [Microterricola pindariensis]PPL15257.1 flagellar M-ring protein FliF [Microterricola pindariensis]
MPRQVTSALARFTAALREFTVAQRTIALLAVAVLVLGVAGLGVWLSRPSYAPLFTGLQAADANAVVEQLQSDAIPYQLSDGGSSILVPQDDVYAQRLKAAAAGLPSASNGGYSLLDKMGVTTSEFQQSVTYKRALEGELASTISALSGVKTASVRLAIPQETVFAAEKQAPTASVFIETTRGVTLGADQVQAIVHLTSASIEGMTSTDVAVIDSSGTVLSAVGGSPTGGAGKLASDYETRVRDSVQAMLDKVVGPGNATVVVAADVSTESAERTAETFTAPEAIASLNESRATESYTGTGGTGAGVLGPDNIAVPGGAGDGTFNSESVTRNNAIDKVTETRTIPAGTLSRQSVSVAVSDASTVNIRNLRALVSAAAGIDVDRGDTVTVEAMTFDASGAAAAQQALNDAKEVAAGEQLTSLVRTGIIALAALLLVVLAAVLVSRSRRARREAVDEAELEAAREALEAAQQQPLILAAQTTPMQLETEVLPVMPIAPDADRTRSEIEMLAERDPQKTAEYLRALMDDRQSV